MEVVEVRVGITASFLWGLPVCQTLSWLWWGSCLGEAILLARVRGEDTETPQGVEFRPDPDTPNAEC